MQKKFEEALHCPSCSQAMENIRKGDWVSLIPLFIQRRGHFWEILEHGFDWEFSPQGHEYWSEIRNDCYD